MALFFPINLRNHLRDRKFDVDAVGWSMRNAAFDHFAMVFHYTTVSNPGEELMATGFKRLPEVYESDSGRRLVPDEDIGSWLFHLIARR